MKRTTYLTKAIAGRKVLAYVNGQYSPDDKRSNLSRKIHDLGYVPQDIGTLIDVAVGGHRRSGADGWKMAIVLMED